MKHDSMLDQQAYSDLANNTEHEPTAPETTAYEKGINIFQKGLRSCPDTANRSSPRLHIPHVNQKEDLFH